MLRPWRQKVAELYAKDLEKELSRPKRWDSYDDFELPGSDWRLWNSIEILDITYASLKDLVRRARQKHRQDHAVSLDGIAENVNLALIQIDPDNWPRRFMGFKSDAKRLNAALEHLRQALDLFSPKYISISVEVEAKQPPGMWMINTPAIYRQLRDSIYALERYLQLPDPHLSKEAEESLRHKSEDVRK